MFVEPVVVRFRLSDGFETGILCATVIWDDDGSFFLNRTEQGWIDNMVTHRHAIWLKANHRGS